MLSRLLLLAVMLAGVPNAARSDETANTPVLPPLPDPYKSFIIDPGSLSLDGKYGFIYPHVSDDDVAYATVKNYLVALKPFRIVALIPADADDNYFVGKNHADFSAVWSDDSSTVIVIEGSRWGPGQVFVILLHNGQAGKISDITAPIIKLAEPDYKSSKADAYNDNYDFLFNGGGAWSFDNSGHVVVVATMATNPKHLDNEVCWEGKFKGLWDIAQGKYVQQKFTRTFSGIYKHP